MSKISRYFNTTILLFKNRLFHKTIVVLAGLGLIGCGGSGGSNNTVITPVQPTLSQTIDTYLDTNLSDNDAGVSVLVRKDGIAIYTNSKGLANKQNSTPITDATGFRLASVSKLFTALAVMQLFEQQQLTLADPIRDYLPELSDAWQPITIHHLLSHQSGIPDYANDFSGSRQEWVRGMTNQALVQHYTTNNELEFAPGTQADYSNSGYVLLAEIVSRVSGLSFAQYMQANIFGPTDMTNSYIIDEQNPQHQDAALNYAESSVPFNFEIFLNGAAAQVSSLEDMNHFVSALQNNEIVSQDTFDLMTQTHSNLPSAGGDFGYAWRKGSGNVTSYDINGSNDGFQTLIILVPVINLEVVILSNGGEATNQHKANIFALINEFYNQ